MFQVPLSFQSNAPFNSNSTAVVSWGLSCIGDNTTAGSVVGLEDGSILLLRRSEIPDKRNTLKVTSPLPSPATLSHASLAVTASGSNSPSGSHISSFPVTSRSRIVSGVTTEQVEAPKNYVDFDDEPEKLKDMLKGRGPKDRSSLEIRDKPPTAVSEPWKRKERPRSMLSSPALTPLSLSSPPSPKASSHPRTSKDLELVCHIVPPRVHRHRVTGLELLHNDELTAILQESGDLAIISNRDGKCIASIQIADTKVMSSDGVKHSLSIHDIWLWSHLHSYVSGENVLLLASATVATESVSTSLDPDENPKDRCRVALLELRESHLIGTLDIKLEVIGQWFCDGLPQTIGLHHTGNQSFVFHSINLDGDFTVQQLNVLLHTPALPTTIKEPQESQLNLGALGPLPNPFKSKAKSPDETTAVELPKSRVELKNASVIGTIATLQGPLLDYRISSIGESLKGVGWSENELAAFTYANGVFDSLFSHPISGLSHAQWLDTDDIAVLSEEQCELYRTVIVDASGEEVSAQVKPTLFQPKLLRKFSIGSYESVEFISSSEILTVDCNQHILRYSWNEKQQRSPRNAPQTIWSPPKNSSPKISLELTAMMIIDMERIMLGYSDGRLRQASFLDLCDENLSVDGHPTSDVALSSRIVELHLAKNDRTNVLYIVGGGDDGSIAIWTADLKLCARWVIFTTPLHRVAQFPDVKGDPLRGAIVCISEDGTIAVIALDGFQFLYVIPGSPFPLQRVYLGADNLLLMYADHRVRLWDVRTREFWRSMSLDKAEELVAQGGWTELALTSRSNQSLRTISECTQSLDVGELVFDLLEHNRHQNLTTACTLSLDLNGFISDSLSVIKSISTNKKQTRNILLAQAHLRSALSLLLTPGLNQDIDDICYDQLGVKRTNSAVGFSSNGFLSLYHYSQPEQCWSLSGDVSAARALSIVAILRALSVFEELSESTSTVTAFYATGLAGPVGSTYKPPNLAFLARRWFESSSRPNAHMHIDLTLGAHLPLSGELRHSARLLFDAAVVRLSDEDTNAIVDEWQHQLPCLQPTADKESALAALALFLCGYLAADKYSMLSTSALTDIAKSITIYLHDEHSVYRVLAIDLCSRGFHVWQHYIDALEILRSLFSLATSSKKDSINAQNVGAQARIAILHIASTNTALFMTTLGLDILNPSSTEQRKSVMQIVAFLIKKRPLVLYPNLPKLLEAVVKSLDPNSTSNREAVLDTATEILGHVVKTFPHVDFHMSSQRLAVGTSEGAMVMYDLNTAIRLYVLEGHKKRIAACSFSPDGRRLVTLSLEESVVLVWKVGSSFVSFFMPGAPPRQGHAGSDPFKTLSFNVGDAGNMTIAETLEFVQFEWTAERSVKLKIRDSILTFST